MNSARIIPLLKAAAGFILTAVIGLFFNLRPGTLEAQTPTLPPVIASRPVTAPPQASPNSLTRSIIAWDSDLKSIDANVGDPEGHLTFNFTNVSTNDVIILGVAPGCHCTTPHVHALPWTIAPGSNGQIGVSIDLRGRADQPGMIFKNLNVTTDKGIKTLNFRVNVHAVTLPQLTDAERAHDMQIARADRQAVFQGQCIICHVKPGAGRVGKPLYDADCGICHDGEHRAAAVPDLHTLKAATNPEFWRIWIAHGKPGTLMPAFATADGGPLTDQQIDLLAMYLDSSIRPKPASPTPLIQPNAAHP